jgi:hypothetical protein
VSPDFCQISTNHKQETQLQPIQSKIWIGHLNVIHIKEINPIQKERKKDHMTNWFVLTNKNGPLADASSANLPNELTIDGLKDYLKKEKFKKKKDVDASLLKVYEKDEERGMHALAPGAKIEHRVETEAKALVVIVSAFQEPVNIPMTSLKDAFEQLRIEHSDDIVES